jgi:hypothetical protein
MKTDTISQRPKWRVQVWKNYNMTHSSPFDDKATADAYYNCLHIPGSEKMLHIRYAGQRSYVLLRLSYMEAPLVGE